jgi:hypothetical protein
MRFGEALYLRPSVVKRSPLFFTVIFSEHGEPMRHSGEAGLERISTTEQKQRCQTTLSGQKQ